MNHVSSLSFPAGLLGPSLASALRTLEVEKKGIETLIKALHAQDEQDSLATQFQKVVTLIANAQGRVIVTGMGKSGHIGRKITATMASTGTPSFFVHPGEASHGDLGMVQPGDVILALSWSGETNELADIISYSRRFQISLIAITSRAEGTLAREADHVLLLPQVEEACPNGLAPTTSSTLQLVLGDALAVALLEHRGFSAQDFRVFHPGGRLGAQLVFVRDIMHKGAKMPLVSLESSMSEAILEISTKGFGCVGVTDTQGRLVGIVTDGDLRRHMSPNLIVQPTQDVMTPAPKTITPDLLAVAALEQLNARRIMALFAVSERGEPLGIIHMHDLLHLGVV